MILVVEDWDIVFEALKAMLERACARLYIEHEIVQSKRLAEVEQRVAECEQHGTPLLILFDNLMQLPGGNFEFIEFIRSLWNEDPATWRGRIPIIIYSDTRTEEFDRFHHRVNSATVHKIPEAGQNNRLKLRSAVQTALQALDVPA